jgi:hypothetical protein
MDLGWSVDLDCALRNFCPSVSPPVALHLQRHQLLISTSTHLNRKTQLIEIFSSCCMARRRRRASKNSTPMTNTNTGYNNGPAYGNNGPAYGNNGPAYGGAPTGQYAPPSGPPPQQYGGGNEGYYGQQNGVTAPQGAYVK